MLTRTGRCHNKERLHQKRQMKTRPKGDDELSEYKMSNGYGMRVRWAAVEGVSEGGEGVVHPSSNTRVPQWACQPSNRTILHHHNHHHCHHCCRHRHCHQQACIETKLCSPLGSLAKLNLSAEWGMVNLGQEGVVSKLPLFGLSQIFACFTIGLSSHKC